MTIRNLLARSGRTLALSAAIVGAVGLTVVPRPAHALGTGAAVGIGLGAFALGTALGTAAASPYYYPGGYYYPPQYYYPPAPAPYPARTCWAPYYQQYVPC
jgi:hypothetical protein